MKKIILVVFGFYVAQSSFAQSGVENVIAVSEVERIEKILASDAMQGRRASSPGIEEASAFIGDEFTRAGLQPLNNSTGFLQSFVMLRPRLISAAASFDGVSIEPKHVLSYTSKPQVKIS